MSVSEAGDLEKFWILENPIIVNEIVVDSYVSIYTGLNMFLVPIKLRLYKFSSYLILIVFFLIPTKKIYL